MVDSLDGTQYVQSKYVPNCNAVKLEPVDKTLSTTSPVTNMPVEGEVTSVSSF